MKNEKVSYGHGKDLRHFCVDHIFSDVFLCLGSTTLSKYSSDNTEHESVSAMHDFTNILADIMQI